MLTKIEELILGGDAAHNICEHSNNGSAWKLVVEPNLSVNEKKLFLFEDFELEYEELILDDGEILEYPLPIIGFECRELGNGKWHFVLSAAEIEWAFVSKWPVKT